MIERQDEARAVAAYEALCAMDATRAAREELVVTGVARATADVLYPQTFEPIAAPLAAYLRQHGRSMYWISMPALVEQRRLSESAIWALGEEQFNDWIQTTPVATKNWEDPAWHPLKEAIDELHPSESAVVLVIAILWSAWWLMGHRKQLDDSSAEKRAIECMNWVVRNLLPDLGAGG